MAAAKKLMNILAVAGWVILIVGPILVVLALNRYTAGQWPFPPRPIHNSQFCQYPNRPLVNDLCDNSDPAVPECIKAPDEAACARDYQSLEQLEYTEPGK